MAMEFCKERLGIGHVFVFWVGCILFVVPGGRVLGANQNEEESWHAK